MMNSINKKLLVICFLATALLTLSTCGRGGDDDPGLTDQEIQEQLLVKNWTLEEGSILLDGSDVSSVYDGFTMNIQGGTFTTTNAGDLFPASGTWQWAGESDTRILTGRGKEISLVRLDESTLEFIFLKTTGNSRSGVSGNYHITLK